MIDQKPELNELQLLETGGKTVRVFESTASRWKDLAIALGFDGPRIESIEKDSLNRAEEACCRMINKWLDGEHDLCESVTWATLIKCLKRINLSELAKNLEHCLCA